MNEFYLFYLKTKRSDSTLRHSAVRYSIFCGSLFTKYSFTRAAAAGCLVVLFLVVLVFGCFGVWLFRCLVVSMSGCFDVWLFRCLVVSVSGIQISGFGFQVKVSQFDRDQN